MNNYAYSKNDNTAAFGIMAWISFGLAAIGMITGLYLLPATLAMKGFLGMAYLFTVSSCFTLAKVVRDKQEGERIINRIESAKTEKLISEYVDPAKVS